MTKAKIKINNDKIDVIQNLQDKLIDAGLNVNVELYDKKLFDKFKKTDKII